MQRNVWQPFGYFLNLTCVLVTFWVFCAATANSQDSVSVDPFEATNIEEQGNEMPPTELNNLTPSENQIENIEMNAVEVMPEPVSEPMMNDSEEMPESSPSAESAPLSPEKKSLEVTVEENGEIKVTDHPMNMVAPIEPEADVVESEPADEELDDAPVQEYEKKYPASKDLQGSPLREYDIESDLQNTPLHQYDVNNELQNSPLLDMELEHSGKEAKRAVKNVREFKKYPKKGLAPQFKTWKAPYNNATVNMPEIEP